MRAEIGIRVLSADGIDVGVIHSLIVDSNSAHVRSVVVEKGHLLTHDVELPLESLQLDPANHIRLSLTAEDVGALPEFDPARYQTPADALLAPLANPPAGAVLPMGGVYPTSPTGVSSTPTAVPVPVGPTEPKAVDRYEKEQVLERAEGPDRQNAIVAAGDDVLSAEGVKVGAVHTVAFDAVSGRIISCVVHKGLLFGRDIELPGEFVVGAADGQVYLKASRATVEQWEKRPAA
jgi:uncharacterized protein YrrD